MTEQARPYSAHESIKNPSVADILRILKPDDPNRWCTFVREQRNGIIYEVVGCTSKEKKKIVEQLRNFAEDRELPGELIVHQSPKGLNAVT